MKKYTSTAALGLRLTWRNVLIVFLVTGACQWFLVYREGFENKVFEYLLDENTFTLGIVGQLALMGSIYSALSGKKARATAYTLRRLRLREGTVTVIWGLLFAGYFVLYWAFQIGMMLLLFGMYDRAVGAAENLLFVSAFRSTYFHNLLPLYEPWAVVRNSVFCLSFGGFAALGAQNARNGRTFPLCMFFVVMILWAILYPHEMASQSGDIPLSIITLVCLAIDIFWSRRWMQYEAN